MNKAVNMLAHGTKWSVWCPGVLLSCVWWWISWVIYCNFLCGAPARLMAGIAESPPPSAETIYLAPSAVVG